MGGLRRAMPVTFWTMTIGYAALIGLPPASGFSSKDAILLHGLERSGPAPSSSPLRLGAAHRRRCTGAYATRAWLMTFFGTGKIQASPSPPPAPPTSSTAARPR